MRAVAKKIVSLRMIVFACKMPGVKCSKESCTLFVPEEKYLNLMDSYEIKVLEKYKPPNFPKCDCNELANLWLSYSSKNPNRPYFRCQDNDPEEKCSFSL